MPVVMGGSASNPAQELRILVLDDSKSMCTKYAEMIRELGYGVTACTRPVDALQILKTTEVDLLICDVEMPEMSGVEVLRLFRRIQPDAMVMMLTANNSIDTAIETMRLGATDYVVKPVRASQLRTRLEAASVQRARARCQLRSVDRLRAKLEDRERQIEASQAEVRKLRRVFRRGLMDGIGVSVNILRQFDEELARHSRRVADLCTRIGARLNLPTPDLIDLNAAALLHDIGLLSVDPGLFDKMRNRAALEPEELEDYRAHPQSGVAISEGIKRLESVQHLIRGHHEYLDGSGYPDGLKGAALSVSLRILCVAEDYDSLANGLEELPEGSKDAQAHLRNFAGIKYDDSVVQALEDVLEELAASGGDAIELSLEDVQPGMILAADVCNAKGVVLLGKGKKLSANAIVRIRSMLSEEEASAVLYVQPTPDAKAKSSAA